MFLGGNRTRILSFSRDALTQLSYQFDNQSTAAHPKRNDGQEASWVVYRLPGCTGFEPACGASTAFADNPDSTARRKDSMDKKRRWWRDSSWQDSNLHLLGFRPSALSQLSYTPLMVEDNQRSAAHRK